MLKSLIGFFSLNKAFIIIIIIIIIITNEKQRKLNRVKC